MLVMLITLTSIYVIFLIALYASNRTGAKTNGNILLGVTLPSDALKDAAVSDIVKKYRKAYTLLTLAFLILAVPSVFIIEHISVGFIYVFV